MKPVQAYLLEMTIVLLSIASVCVANTIFASQTELNTIATLVSYGLIGFALLMSFLCQIFIGVSAMYKIVRIIGMLLVAGVVCLALLD